MLRKMFVGNCRRRSRIIRDLYFIITVDFISLGCSKAIVFVQDYGPDIDLLLSMLLNERFRERNGQLIEGRDGAMREA